MSRSAKAWSSAADVLGDGGIGVGTAGRRRSRSRRGCPCARGSHAGAAPSRSARAGTCTARRRRRRRPGLPKLREELGEPLCALHGIELRRVGEPGRRVEVVVGAERDDEMVGLVHTRVGRDGLGDRIDRRNGLAQEPDARLGQMPIREPDRVGRRAPEQHVELGVPEDEHVPLVDHGDVDLVAQLVGQGRRELEAAESRSQNDDARLHPPIIVTRPRVTPNTEGIRRPGNPVGPDMQQTPTERSRRRIPIVPIVIVAILALILIGFLISSGGGGGGGGY